MATAVPGLPPGVALGPPYTEVAPSPQETWTEDGFQAICTFKVAWNKRLELALYLLGGYQRVGSATMFRYPHRYPHNDNGAIALRIRCTSYGQALQTDSPKVITYTHAHLAVTYEIPDEDDVVGTDAAGNTTTDRPISVEDIRPSAEFLAAPKAGLYWGDGGKVNGDQVPGRLIRRVSWGYTRKDLERIPFSLFELVGGVNNAVIKARVFDKEFPIETVLCGKPEITRRIYADGTKRYDLRLLFTYNADGWNKFLRTPGSDPEYVYNHPTTFDDSTRIRFSPPVNFDPLIDLITKGTP